METSNSSNGEPSNDPTLFAVDTLVSLSAPQENDEEPTTLDTCGLGLETPLAHYDPGTRSWKMYGDISLWEEQSFLETLPKSGMTRNGELYPQPEWERLTEGNGSLSWPTPRTCSAMAATITPESVWDPKRFPNLETVVGRRMWPTPTTVDTFTPKSRKNPTLGDAARKADGSNGKLNPTWVEWLMGFPLGWTDLEDLETP